MFVGCMMLTLCSSIATHKCWARYETHPCHCLKMALTLVRPLNNAVLFSKCSLPECDFRVCGPSCVLSLTNFGRVCVQAERRRRECCICNPEGKGSGLAAWVTHDDPHAPCTPCFWCDECYRQMHYDDSHDLLYGGYVAFPYQYELGQVKPKSKPKVKEGELMPDNHSSDAN